MGGRGLKIQIRCKNIFQLFCNCLKFRENNFISSQLAIHGLRGYLSIFDQNVHKCSLSDTKEGMSLVFSVMHCISVSYESFLRNLLIFWFLKMIGGIKQSMKMSNQKSHKGIACVRYACVCVRVHASACHEFCLPVTNTGESWPTFKKHSWPTFKSIVDSRSITAYLHICIGGYTRTDIA